MRFYEFRKWFFDIIGGRDDYLILFFTQLKVGKSHRMYFQMHGSKRGPSLSFNPEISCIRTLGQKGNDGGVLLFDEGEVRFDNCRCSISLEFDECKVNLRFSSDKVRWPQSSVYFDNQKNGYIEWIPLIPGSSVSGSIETRGRLMVFNDARGYCDEVLSTILPWKVPVSQLHWGRLNHEKIKLSYSVMSIRNSIPDVSRLYLEADGHFYILDGFSFKIIQQKKSTSMNLLFADKYIIQGTSGDLNLTIEVSDHEEMIINDFMDYRNEYGKMATGILKWISRNPHGIKFSASANIDIRIRNETYRMESFPFVDEYVEFRQ
jgi:hypothetical protein